MAVKTMGKKALAAVLAAVLCLGLLVIGVPVSAAGVDIPQTIDSVAVGSSITLSAGQAGATWSSSNTAVATVDQNGVVTGHSMGKATITATYGGQSDSCTVSVGFLNGIDVSHHQGQVNWDAVAASGVDFVMIRVGFGWEGDQVDKQFVNNVQGAYEHGIPYGLYFYSYAGTESTPAEEDVQKEAAYCLSAMERIQPYLSGMALPVAYDLEEDEQVAMSGDRLTGMVEIFANALRNAGYSTMVYADNRLLPNLNLTKLEGEGIGFWYARYPAAPNFSTQMTIGTTGVVPDMWQYASDGSNPGIGGGSSEVDQDLIYLDMASAIAQIKKIAKPDVTVSGSTATLSFAARTLYLESYDVVRVRGDQVAVLAQNLPRYTTQYIDTGYQAGDKYFLNFHLNSVLRPDWPTYYGLNPGDMDLDGNFNVTDVMALAQGILHPETLPNNGYTTTDWNNDNKLNVTDVMTAAQEVLKYAIY